MNRLRRHLFAFLSLASLLVLAASSTAWLRSALASDTWRRYTWNESTRRFEMMELRIESGRLRIQDTIQFVPPTRVTDWFRKRNRTIERLTFPSTLARVNFEHTRVTWPAAPWTDGGSESSYTCVLWPIVLLSAILPAFRARRWVVARRLRLHRSANGLCQTCGYDLRASTGRCPECGAAIASDARHERVLRNAAPVKIGA